MATIRLRHGPGRRLRPSNEGSTDLVGSVPRAEWIWGTHAKAVLQANQRSFIIASAAAAVVVVSAVPGLVSNANASQEFRDPAIRSFITNSAQAAPAAAPAQPPLIVTAPQRDLTQRSVIFTPQAAEQGYLIVQITGAELYREALGGKIFPAALTPPAPATQLGAFLRTAPQVDLRKSSAVWGTPPPLQGKLGAFASTLPQWQSQDRPTRVIWQAVVTPPAPVSGVLGAFIGTLPQTEERPTRTIYPSLRAGTTGPLGAFSVTAPQFDARTRSIIWQPVATPVAPLAPIIRQLVLGPQFVDLTLQGWIHGTPAPRQGRVPPLVRGEPLPRFDYTMQALLVHSAPPLFQPQPVAVRLVQTGADRSLDVETGDSRLTFTFEERRLDS